jgi:hypothetical protein
VQVNKGILSDALYVVEDIKGDRIKAYIHIPGEGKLYAFLDREDVTIVGRINDIS